MVERVKFPGSEEPVAPVREEKLNEIAQEEGDEANAEKPKYKQDEIGPRVGDPIEASAAVEQHKEQLANDDGVPLLFPREVRLQHAGLMHVWAPGVHVVPITLAGKTPKEMHWYLKAHRVRRAGGVVPNSAIKELGNQDGAEA